MRIERTSQFKRDYKRESKGQHRSTLAVALGEVLNVLVTDQPRGLSTNGTGSYANEYHFHQVINLMA